MSTTQYVPLGSGENTRNELKIVALHKSGKSG